MWMSKSGSRSLFCVEHRAARRHSVDGSVVLWKSSQAAEDADGSDAGPALQKERTIDVGSDVVLSGQLQPRPKVGAVSSVAVRKATLLVGTRACYVLAIDLGGGPETGVKYPLKLEHCGGGRVLVANSPKEVIEKCRLTYTMLSDLAASEAVYHAEEGILAGRA